VSKTATRPYIVTRKSDSTIRLIDASSPSTALSHVARDENTVERASARQVGELMSNGHMLEYAGTEHALGYSMVEPGTGDGPMLQSVELPPFDHAKGAGDDVTQTGATS
jgi:hypothetical protein